MDQFNNYTELAPNFQVGEMCYTTMPCKHRVKIDNMPWKMMFGTDIYEYCVNNNIPIPEHFQDYKSMVDQKKYNKLIIDNVIANFKDNYLLDQEYYKKDFLLIACKYTNMEFIKYLVEEKNTQVTYSHLANCVKSPEQMNIFKYLLDKSGLNIGALGTHYLGSGGNNLLSVAAYHNNLELVKYLMEELNILLNEGNDYTKPLIELGKNLHEYDTGVADELIDYLSQKSIEQKVMYSGSDIHVLEKLDTYNDFVDNNLIYNFGSEPNVQVIVEHIGTEFDIDQINVKSSLEYDGKNLMATNISNLSFYRFSLPISRNYLKNITYEIQTNIPDIISSISFYLNNSQQGIKFKKSVDGNISKFTFDPIEPFLYCGAVFTDKCILFEIDTKDQGNIFIESLNIKMVFEYNKLQSSMVYEDTSFQIDEITWLQCVNGIAMFEEIQKTAQMDSENESDKEDQTSIELDYQIMISI